MVECSYSSGSTATGFQVIAQQSNANQAHKLYINKTTDRQTPASVVVEENGIYQITVFAIRGERGIVNSGVEYTQQLSVVISSILDIDTTNMVAHCTNTTSKL